MSVNQEAERWRKGQDIFSRHYVTLAEALQGCQIKVPTVHGEHSIDLSRFDAGMKHIFEGKGVLKTKISGDDAAKAGNHIAFVKPIIPRNVDS